MTETTARSASAGKKRPVKKTTTGKKLVKKPSRSQRGGCCGNDDGPSSTGGGFVDDLGKLSIPFGLVAANIGIKALYNKKKTGATKAAPKRSASAGRRRMTGGMVGGLEGENEGEEEGEKPAVAEPSPVAEFTDADYDRCKSNTYIAKNPPTATGGSGMLSGGALQQRQHHAMIAQEFRRMAHEIGSFLDGAARKKLATKPKTPGTKITPASAKRPASAKKTTRK